VLTFGISLLMICVPSKVAEWKNPFPVKSKMADGSQIRQWDILGIFLGFFVARFQSNN